MLAPVVQIRCAVLDLDRRLEGVQHGHCVSSRFGRFDEAARAVTTRRDGAESQASSVCSLTRFLANRRLLADPAFLSRSNPACHRRTSSDLPPESRTLRRPRRGNSTVIAGSERLCSGCNVKRRWVTPPRSVSSRSNAFSVDVRAPVSTFALMVSTPRSGKRTHSLQPIGAFYRAIGSHAFRTCHAVVTVLMDSTQPESGRHDSGSRQTPRGTSLVRVEASYVGIGGTRCFAPRFCSIEIEMSGLVEIEMSSFGFCSRSTGERTRAGGGDADVEPTGARSIGGVAPSEGGPGRGEPRG